MPIIMPDAPRVPRDQNDDDTMPSLAFPPPNSFTPTHAPKVTTDVDSIDDESDLDVLSEQDGLERAFELKDLTRNDEPSGFQGSNYHHEYHNANTDEEKPSRPRRSKKARFLLYTPEEERAVLRKLDTRLVLFMALLYMLSFLDRSNIGNARIAGMSRDLQLSYSQYEWLLTGFYIAYILFEWMTLLYRIVPPHIYIAVCVASWGLIASLQSVATSFPFLLALRALLGISEAAFGPGVPFYLSFFFKREELALRTGLFISAAPLATSFASSLAWVITKMGEKSQVIAPWRMLFLVEGFPSVVVAVFVWIYIPDSPGTAVFLTRQERKVATQRLSKEKDVQGQSTEKGGLNWREILQTLADPKCYITAAMFFSCNVAFSSLPVFLPTIIEEMGYSAVTSQALSAPPYLVAFAAVLLTAYLSDRSRNRSAFVCFHALLGACGYSIIAIAGLRRAGAAWRYAGIYLAATGFFSAITIIITWTINNQDSDSKKGTGIAMLNIIGQMGPLLGTRLYPDSDQPYYVRGMTVCAGFMTMVFVLSLGLRFILAASNRKTAIAYSRVEDEDSEEQVAKGQSGAGDEQFQFLL